MMKRHLATVVAGLLLIGTAWGDAYDDLVTYDWTKDRAPLASIEEDIRKAKDPGALRVIEGRLIKALENPRATYACRQFVCRMLRRMGSDACVPALEKLLTDQKLSHMARFALERMPAKEAGEALRRAMNKLSGDLRIGVISSLGGREDKQAVPALARLAGGSDPKTARAAIVSLGRIGSLDAAKALEAVKPPEALVNARGDALLRCADRLLSEGNAAYAGSIYGKMFDTSSPLWIRVAALRGLVFSLKDKAVDQLLAQLRQDQADLKAAAQRYMIEAPGTAFTEALAEKISSQPAETQSLLIDLLSERGDKAAAPAVARLISSTNETVRLAAINALGSIGDASSVSMLVKLIAAGGPAGEAATRSLNRLKGPEIGAAMSRLLESGDVKTRAAILSVLAMRTDKTVAPVLLKAAGDKDETIRRTAIKGLSLVGGEEELGGMLALLKNAKGDERAELSQAIGSTALRLRKVESAVTPIADALKTAIPETKADLIGVLGRLGGDRALEAVRAECRSGNESVADAAVRALTAWPDPAPAGDLEKIIQTTKNRTHKVLALRGYLRMANLLGVEKAGDAIGMYKKALTLADRTEEKKSVLSGLADARSVEALRMAEGLLGDPALASEAQFACVRIAGNLRDVDPDAARTALKKIQTLSNNPTVKQQAGAVLNEMDRYRGFVTSWLASGPYTGGNLFNTAYPPEKKDAKGVKWAALSKGVGPQIINLLSTFPGSNRAAYMKTHVDVPADHKVRLEIGSDDGVKVWINGKLVHANNASRGVRIGEDKVNVQLKKGRNEILLKVTQGGGDYGFAFRIVKADGGALEGMKVNPAAK